MGTFRSSTPIAAGYSTAFLPAERVRSGFGRLAGRFCDRLDSLEGAEHVALVATLPQEPPERTPDLGEEVVAEVE